MAHPNHESEVEARNERRSQVDELPRFIKLSELSKLTGMDREVLRRLSRDPADPCPRLRRRSAVRNGAWGMIESEYLAWVESWERIPESNDEEPGDPGEDQGEWADA